MNKQTRFLLFFLAAVFLAVTLPASSSAGTTAWTLGEIDAPKYFSTVDPRAVVVENTTNRPHIVYGRDHLYHAYHNGTAWQYETIANSTKSLGSISVALDSSNKLHVSYVEDRQIRYATNASGSWVVEDAVGMSGGGVTSIAVDSAGNIHIAYDDWTGSSGNRFVKYATNASGSWISESIASPIGYYHSYSDPSIAVDSADNVHMSYVYNYSYSTTQYHRLYHTTNASGSFVPTLVYSYNATTTFGSTSIAVDSGDNLHIAFRRSGYSGGPYAYIHYTTNASGSWSQVVTVASSRADYFSMTLDSTANAYISYYTAVNGYLVLATNASGSWYSSTLDSTGDVGWGTSIGAEPGGNLHIAYFDRTNGKLKYTTNTSGSFVMTDLDTTRTSGYYSSLALDGSGKMHLSTSYSDGSSSALKYLTNASGSWVGTIVDDSSASTGYYTSIAMDSNGKAHISYKDDTNDDLKYATNATGAWANTVVDSEDGVGTSIALDSSNKAHISYRTISGAKYATNASGSWAIETIASSGSLASSDQTDIALDSNGKAHVVYSASGIYYATNATGTWATTALETTYSTWPSLAIDSSDKVHIVYGKSSSLIYATNASGSWVKTTVGSGYGMNSIAIDSGDNVHIVSGAYYITNAPGYWYSSYSADFGSDGSIALDSTDGVYVSFYNQYLGDLLYASSADPIAPTGSIIINSDDPYTDSSSVILTLTCDDGTGSGCSEMQFVNQNVNSTWSTPEPSGTSKSWTIQDSYDGAKTVYARFKDAQGNWSDAYSDTITLDTAPPNVSWFRINDDAVSTASTSVTLTYYVGETSEVAEMCFSNTDTCSSWEAYAASKAWTIPGGDGTKTVYAWFKDVLGHVMTTAATDTILLDTAAPTGSVTIDSGSAYTNSSSVALALSASDVTDVSEMCISNSGTCTAWEAYVSSKAWTLGGGDGNKTVSVWFRDSLGNESSSPVTDYIIYDTTEPGGSITINSGALFTYSPSVSLNLITADLSGVSEMCVSNTVACFSWEAYTTTKEWTLTAGDDIKTVFVRFRDNAGNENFYPVYDSIVLDESDNDGDSMPDLWEQAIVDADPADGITSIWDVLPDDDFDGDGISNYQEYLDGTDPTTPDILPDQVGVFRDGWWYLDSNGTPGWNAGDTALKFGLKTDIPLVGDWDGDGRKELGVFRDGWWYLDSNGTPGWNEGDMALKFGFKTDIPVTGDWDGDGIFDIGIFRDGLWYLDSNGTPGWNEGDTVLDFGIKNDIPVVGDWDGDRISDVGVFRDRWWYLDSNGTPGWNAGDTALKFGFSTDIPVSGDWDGNGTTDIGVFRDGWWYLDSNGSPGWNEGDTALDFGLKTDIPISGAW